jgi:hypothetical protein
LTKLGFTHQIRDISSFSKLTGLGITLVGNDIVNILESVLPARFGGCPADYQLVERDGASQTEVELRVSPRLRPQSPDEIASCFLDEVSSLFGGALARREWQQMKAFRVVVGEPYTGSSGKVMSLHLLGSSERS